MYKFGVFLFSALFAGGAFAQEFVVKEISDAHHAGREALNHLAEADSHHAGQFGGHEGKARQLLLEAMHEMEAADRFYKEHPKPPRR